jgi:outer membrane protein
MKPTASLISNIGSFYFNSLVADNEYQFFKQIQLNFYQQFRLNVSIPIFNKGISKLQVEKSKINEDIIINDILIEKKDLSNTIKKIFFDKNQNFKNYILSKEVEDDMKKTKELTGKSYTEGYSTIYELNNSTKNWVEAISILKQFKYKYYFDLLLLDIYTKGYSNIKYLF